MKKIEIDTSMTVVDIMREYDVSRSTAWRARKRGWLAVNYHNRTDKKQSTAAQDRQIRKVLDLPALNVAGLTSVPVHILYEVHNSGYGLTADEFKALKSELLDLAKEIDKWVENPVGIMVILVKSRYIKHYSLTPAMQGMVKRYFSGKVLSHQQINELKRELRKMSRKINKLRKL